MPAHCMLMTDWQIILNKAHVFDQSDYSIYKLDIINVYNTQSHICHLMYIDISVVIIIEELLVLLFVPVITTIHPNDMKILCSHLIEKPYALTKMKIQETLMPKNNRMKNPEQELVMSKFLIATDLCSAKCSMSTSNQSSL